MAVKEMVEERLAHLARGVERREGGAGEEWCGEGVLRRPFIGSEGEQGSWTGRGIGRPMVRHHYGTSGLVGRGNGGVSGE
jgi:hypothetical protein